MNSVSTTGQALKGNNKLGMFWACQTQVFLKTLLNAADCRSTDYLKVIRSSCSFLATRRQNSLVAVWREAFLLREPERFTETQRADFRRETTHLSSFEQIW